MIGEGLDLGFKVARQKVIFEQDVVLEVLVPLFDLALRLRVYGGAADMDCARRTPNICFGLSHLKKHVLIESREFRILRCVVTASNLGWDGAPRHIVGGDAPESGHDQEAGLSLAR